MDSHVFRLVAADLCRLLRGARVEKIHGPAPGVQVFTLFAFGARRRLVLRHGRQFPLLFFTGHRLPNPARPPAQVMRLRKYCQNRRLGAGVVDVTSRRIAFPVGGSLLPDNASLRSIPDKARPEPMPGSFADGPDRPESDAPWLLLDLRQGAEMVFSLPPGFGTAPVWPGTDVTDALCDRPWSKKEADGLWREYAVLTPPLRETLAALDVMEGRALLVDLEAGGGEVFLYADASGRLALCSAWPLPEVVLRRRGLEPWYETPAGGTEETGDPEDMTGLAGAGGPERAGGPNGSGGSSVAPTEDPEPAQGRAACLVMDHGGGDAGFRRGFPALFLASRADEAVFFADFGLHLEREDHRPRRREAGRVAKLLAKLDQEEARLKGLAALRDDACLLRAVLWQYPAEARLKSVSVPADAEESGKTRLITLNPLITLRENMARMFHASARGARGLEHLKQRRAEVLGALSEAAKESETTGASGTPPEAAGGPQAAEGAGTLTKTVGKPAGGGSEARPGSARPGGVPYRGAESLHPAGPRLVPDFAPQTGRQGRQRGREAKAVKDVACFVSSDGFTLLRGKNASGNQALLKLGQPHDLWLHALDGPSAHLIIRRPHAGVGIPDATLLEAAALVGEKSWQRHDAKAHIMVALLRHVRAVKGGAPGTVRVDEVLRTVTVALDGRGERSQK